MSTDHDSLSAQEVADFLGVSLHSLRAYRQRPKDDPLRLAGTRDPSNGNVVTYTRDEVFAFVARNSTFRERILASLAPAAAIGALTPAPVQPHGLFALHQIHQPQPAESTSS